MNQNHQIYKQIVEVEFSSRREALDGQNRLSQLCERELNRLMETVFDEMVSPDDHLRIQKLEVDLGVLSAGSFEEDITRKLASQLQDQLRRHLHYARSGQNNSRSKHTDKKEQDEEEVRLTSKYQSAIEQFAYFIRMGRYPWWAGKTTAASLDDLTEMLIRKNTKEFTELLKELYKSESYGRRIIHQLSDSTLEKILQLFIGDSRIVKKLRSMLEDVTTLHASSPIAPLNRANFRLLAWRSAFDTWVKEIHFRDNIQFQESKPNAPANRIEQPLLIFLIYFLNRLTVTSGNQRIQPGWRPTYQMQIRFLQRRVSAAGMKKRPLGSLLNSAGAIKPTDGRSFFKDINSTKDKKQSSGNTKQIYQERKNKINPETERLEVDNAGLVLIAPFLPIFFDALGLLKEKTFITPQASERAALILQFMATGKSEMPEHHLILNKILCGIDIDEPLPLRLDLSDHEIEEINNLLDSVIEHWTALKRTSVRGLRDTFINREGILTPQQNGWKLFVERITPDVLIDRLPWSISIIKLPWTNEIIHTEW